MKTMKDYHDLHLKCEVFIVSWCFGKFDSLENHDLWPSHYLNAPDLSWYTMLNVTKVGVKLFSDSYMYLFNKDMKSYVSYISKKYSKAINSNLKSYDPKQESKHIIYLGAVMPCPNFSPQVNPNG